MFNSIKELKTYGFSDFYSISYVCQHYNLIPKLPGVYIVIIDKAQKIFMNRSTGGSFKGKDPQVPIDTLNDKWVDETLVLYIGKAGSQGSSSNLQKRIKAYIDFGNGKPVGHWGGRYIWQLKDSGKLKIAWKVLDISDSPRDVEKALINQFLNKYKMLPFANLQK